MKEEIEKERKKEENSTRQVIFWKYVFVCTFLMMMICLCFSQKRCDGLSARGLHNYYLCCAASTHTYPAILTHFVPLYKYINYR